MVPVLVAAWFGELAALGVAATTDLRRRIIPDSLVLLLALNGVVLRLADWVDWRGFLFSMLAAVGVLLPLGQFARAGVIGGGDAKLIAAVTLLVPVYEVPGLLLAIAIAGGVMSCGYLVMRALEPVCGVCRPEGCWLRRTIYRELRRSRRGVPMPYALAVLSGTCWFTASPILFR